MADDLELQVDPRRMRLVRDNDRLLMSCDTGGRLEVTIEEANFLLNHNTPESLGYASAKHGIFTTPGAPQTDLIKHESSILRSQIPKDGLCVMLDTSTIRNALDCLQGICLPIHLLDLSLLTFSAVFFDRIVVQPTGVLDEYDHDNCRFEPVVPEEVFCILEYPEGFVPNTLWSICVAATKKEAVEEDDFAKAWGEFLSIPPSELPLDLTIWDTYQHSPAYWSGIFADRGHSSVPRVIAKDIVGKRPTRETLEHLSLMTLRTLFNDSLAGFLGLPYYSSSFRACVHSKLIARKVQYRHVLDRLLSETLPQAAESSDGPYLQEVGLPFIFGIVARRMKDPDDFWPVVMELREEAATLRESVLKDKTTWAENGSEYLRHYISNMQKNIPKDARTAEEAIFATVSAAASVVTATAPHAVAFGLVLKLARLLNPAERVRNFYIKRFRPEVYFLMSLADEARRLISLDQELARIWGTYFSRERHDFLRVLAETHPASFLRLPKL